jgi:hypothetical protein
MAAERAPRVLPPGFGPHRRSRRRPATRTGSLLCAFGMRQGDKPMMSSLTSADRCSGLKMQALLDDQRRAGEIGNVGNERIRGESARRGPSKTHQQRRMRGLTDLGPDEK